MVERQRPECSSAVLTPRQREIINLLALGFSYNEVGLRLDISEASAKYQIHQIFQMTNKKSVPQAVFALAREGLIDLTEVTRDLDLHCVSLLTRTQLRVLELLTSCSDGENKSIAVELGRKPKSVKNHLFAIYETLSVSGRVQAGLMYMAAEKAGIIPQQVNCAPQGTNSL